MRAARRVAVVTGGASGIGAALCRAFAAQGAVVVVADLDDAGARAVAGECAGTAVRVDVTDERDVARLVRDVEVAHGRIDVYCSNAGIAVGGGEDPPDAAWEASWRVHVMAHVYAARALLPGMLARGEGRIVGTVSAAGLLNHLGSAPYAATKAAGLSFLEWLAITYRRRGIRVSALCPQGVRTPMLESAGDAGSYLAAGAIGPDVVAACVIDALDSDRFLLLPDASVAEYTRRRGADHDRWLRGMQQLRDRVTGAT